MKTLWGMGIACILLIGCGENNDSTAIQPGTGGVSSPREPAPGNESNPSEPEDHPGSFISPSIEVDQLQIAQHFRITDPAIEDPNYRLTMRLRAVITMYLDRNKNVYVRVRVQSGDNFRAGWVNFGLDSRNGNPSFASISDIVIPRGVSVGVTFWDRLNIEWGGQNIENGLGNDGILWSNNGYFDGARARFNAKNTAFGKIADELIISAGNIRGFERPSFLDRAEDLFDGTNYIQIMAVKKVNSVIDLGAQYFHWGVADFIHLAAHWRVSDYVGFVDQILTEGTLRVGAGQTPDDFGNPSNFEGELQTGWHLQLTKSFGDFKAQVGGLYDPTSLGLPTSNFLGFGSSAYIRMNYQLNKIWSAWAQFVHTFDNGPSIVKNQLRIGFTANVGNLFKKQNEE